MSETVSYNDLVAMLRGAVAQIREHHETLSKLDSFGGDGDHGTTMLRAMGLVEKTVDGAGAGTLEALLEAVGWAIMGVDGGATGPLFGAFFTGMAAPAAGHEALDATALAAVFESGLAAVRKYTKAQVGDKTLMDALAPAVGAVREVADEGAGPCAAVQRAAQAAAQGAATTEGLQARFGRAKNVGEKSIGAADPGATSVSYMFHGFAEAICKGNQ